MDDEKVKYLGGTTTPSINIRIGEANETDSVGAVHVHAIGVER